jgi:hypothetical protein
VPYGILDLATSRAGEETLLAMPLTALNRPVMPRSANGTKGRGVDGHGNSPMRRHFGHSGLWRFSHEVVVVSDLSVRYRKMSDGAFDPKPPLGYSA